MTLGRKLSNHRKLAGLTQQQLGEHLSLSAQAISKWENDMAEPDLSTLKKLAELYKTTLDDLLNLDCEDVSVSEPAEDNTNEEKSSFAPIGFCKECGITVTEENLGCDSPVVLCKKCLTIKNENERIAAERAAKQRAEENRKIEMEKRANRARLRRIRGWSLSIAAIATVIFLILGIASLVDNFSGGFLAFTLIFSYILFSFIACLFYEDCFVRDVIFEWTSKSISWPGLIFEFDIDGFIWLISMKLLFFILGALFGIVTFIIGTILGLICAPFVFPYVLRNVNRCIALGTKCDLVDND
ncbi:MAG: helix-turn-helix domain-containing protein [Clostridia bacterium]|nr:helix-turn-helix domain-containing protein [Clostridia bacterium]